MRVQHVSLVYQALNLYLSFVEEYVLTKKTIAVDATELRQVITGGKGGTRVRRGAVFGAACEWPGECFYLTSARSVLRIPTMGKGSHKVHLAVTICYLLYLLAITTALTNRNNCGFLSPHNQKALRYLHDSRPDPRTPSSFSPKGR